MLHADFISLLKPRYWKSRSQRHGPWSLKLSQVPEPGMAVIIVDDDGLPLEAGVIDTLISHGNDRYTASLRPATDLDLLEESCRD